MELSILHSKAQESKEKLLEYVKYYVSQEDGFLDKTEDENRLILNFNNFVLKVAFNFDGAYENFKEVSSYSQLIKNNQKSKIDSLIDKREIFSVGQFQFYFFDDFYNKARSYSTYEPYNLYDFFILKVYSESFTSNFELDTISNDSFLYLQLKETIMAIEHHAFIGKISPNDFYFKNGKVIFKNLDNLYPIKPLKYEKLLRFDLEDFVNNYKDNWESLYRYPHSKKTLTFKECFNQFLETALYEQNQKYEILFSKWFDMI